LSAESTPLRTHARTQGAAVHSRVRRSLSRRERAAAAGSSYS